LAAPAAVGEEAGSFSQEFLSRQCRDWAFVEGVVPGQHGAAEPGLAQRVAGALAVGDVQQRRPHGRLLPLRFRYPGRRPLDDRKVLQGILFVLHTGIGWEHLPQELGFGCGMTAWRRLRAQQAGVWEKLHELLLAELHAADQLEWERAIADSSHLQAKKGASRPAPARSTAAAWAASTISS
jgi:transposase